MANKGGKSIRGVTPGSIKGLKGAIVIIALLVAFVAIIFWLQGEMPVDQLSFLPYIKSHPERWDPEQIKIFKLISYFLGAISIGLFAIVFLKRR